MASGVKVDDSVKDLFSKISITTKKQEKFKFVVLKFSDDNSKIVVDSYGKKGDEGWEYDKLIENLPADDVRYIAYDFDFLTKEGTPSNKLILCSWCPGTSPIKKKMLGASSFGALKLALATVEKYFEGDCPSELDSKAVMEKLGASENLNK